MIDLLSETRILGARSWFSLMSLTFGLGDIKFVHFFIYYIILHVLNLRLVESTVDYYWTIVAV